MNAKTLPHINDLRRNGYDPTELDADEYVYPPTEDAPMAKRPDLFVNTVNNLQYGASAIELSEQLNECVEAARKTGKKATLTLTLTIKPVGRDSGQYELREEIKAKIPTMDRGMTLMFGTPEGNLTRTDPRQGELQLKAAPEATKPDTLKTA